MTFKPFLMAAFGLLVLGHAAAQTSPELTLQFLSDSEKASFSARLGCVAEIVKLPENKTVAMVGDNKAALVKVGKASSEHYVYFRNAKEAKFGGLTPSASGDYVVEASLQKNGDEALCEPVGCRAIPARMLLDVSSREGKNRLVDSNVTILDKCGRNDAKRLLN